MSERSGASVGRSVADEARNRSFGAGVIGDPYPVYHRLLRECPVHEGGLSAHFGIPVVAESFSGPTYTVHSYDACVTVLKQDATFSNAWYEPSLNAMIGPNVLGMDEPAHKRMRLLVQPAFSKREMRWWRTDIVEPIVDRQLGELEDRGAADLYSDFAAFIPARVIVAALGLPEADLASFFEWAIVMTSAVETPENRAKAAAALTDYVTPLCEQRRRRPSRDLISLLVQARVADADVAPDEVIDRRPLSDAEIDGFIRLLLVGGTSTTYRAFGVLLYLLLSHPEQLAAVRNDRPLVEHAIEESLRLEQPLVQWGRTTTREVELGGVTLAAGCPVIVNIGAANHDPREWPDPDEFDISRAHPDRHLTFGFGKHHCLGVHLARMELDVMLNAVLDRLPNLRFDPERDAPELTGLGFRMVTGLPCRWDV